MKPVFQTREGWPEGNCTEACIASVLELSLEDIPVIQARDCAWLEELNGYLAQHNVYAIPLNALEGFVPRGWHLIGGKSPRGSFGHYVVARDGKMVHDPHPSRDGLRTEEDYLVFVTLDPGRANGRDQTDRD